MANNHYQENLATLLRALDGESTRIINETLAAAGHEGISRLADLRKNGSEDVYTHPETGDVVVSIRTKSRQKRYRTQEQDVIRIYGPDEAITARISVDRLRIARSSSYRNDETVPVKAVSEITEYNPPKVKQVVNKRKLKRLFQERRKERDIARKAARREKINAGSGMPPQADPGDNGDFDLAEYFGINVTQGTIKRRRRFRTPSVGVQFRQPESSFTLGGRTASDLIKHPNGSYTTIQFDKNGGTYQVVNYGRNRQPLTRTTCDSHGEALEQVECETNNDVFTRRKGWQRKKGRNHRRIRARERMADQDMALT